MGLNTTPATWVANAVVTAAQMNTEVRDAITGIESAYTSWTPTVSSGFTVGNGVFVGRQQRIGKMVDAQFTFTFGSTSSFTTPLVLFPVAINTSYPIISNVGSVTIGDTSAGSAGRFTGSAIVASVTASGFGSFGFVTIGGSATNLVPMTWAVNDLLSATIRYEAA